MNSAILALVALGVSIQQVVKKEYNNRIGGTFAFSAASAAISLIFYFAISQGKLDFSKELFGYSIAFSLSYSCALVGSFLAIKHGPLSLSSLVFQYSLLIPTFYGLIVYREPLKPSLIIGLLLLAISLFLVNKRSEKAEMKISLRWLIFLLIGFAGNGFCSTVQKIQQYDFGGKYKSEFMIIAITVSSVVLFCISFFTEKKNALNSLKNGLVWIVICGLANGGVNFGTMVLTNVMSASVMFPIISAGSVIITCIASILIYKEQLSKAQITGFAVGIAAIVSMNL